MEINESESRKLEALECSMGQDLIGFMKDDGVFEIMLNSDGRIWVDRFDKGCIDTGIRLIPKKSETIIKDIAALTGQVISENHPTLSGEIPDSYLFDSSRFQGMLPNVVSAPTFNIRKHPKQVLTLDDYVKQGVMSESQRDIIIQAVHDKKNIIAAGGTKSGKTTLLNAILQEVSKMTDRVIMIEDTPELRCTAKNFVSLRTMPEVNMDELLRATLRMTPDRIVVGEVRSGEALSLMDAWSTGHSGGCSTVHSNSAEDTLLRLENMTSRVAKNPQQMTISRAVNVIVYLKYENLVRKVREIITVDGYDAEKKCYITKRIE